MKPISTLTFSPLHPTHPHLGAATALYETAFPEAERRDTALWLDLMTTSRQFHALAIMTGEAFAGLITWWQLTDDFCYVEHFAISATLRGKGYGSRVLEKFMADVGKMVLLEIDPISDAVSEARWRFYKRCGFFKNPYPHKHSAYRVGYEPHSLVVLTTKRGITESEYMEFSRDLG